MVSKSWSAVKPSSFSARDGSAVRSGTSPRLRGKRITLDDHMVGKRGVSVPPTDDLVFVVEASCFTHGLHDLKNTHPLSLPQIIRLEVAGGSTFKYVRTRHQCVESEEMPRSQVKDMQIVTNAGSVSAANELQEKMKKGDGPLTVSGNHFQRL